MSTLDGAALKRLAIAALASLERESARINGLNVFPVPDGDTGTNMSLTLRSALAGPGHTSIADAARALAEAALRGARGNSGTILSQFIQGFYLGVEHLQEANPSELAHALSRAADVAYQAVVEPQEGTMLTVGRAAAEAAVEAAGRGESLEQVLQAALEHAAETLERTPDLLPILKEAGVVDAGGEGLVVAARAALQALRTGVEIEIDDLPAAGPVLAETSLHADAHSRFAINEVEILYKYCTEFLVAGAAIDIDSLKAALAPLGDSLIAVGGPTLVKVHVHTDRPGLALDVGCEWGDLSHVSVANMQEQNREQARTAPLPEHKSAATTLARTAGFGIVAVSWGKGFEAIFRSYGIEHFVSASSSCKPSAGQLLDAVARVEADRVILLPCHKDVLLAAEQAAGMSDKDVAVLPVCSSPEAVAAVLEYDKSGGFEENVEAMQRAAVRVAVAQVTRAARDAVIGGHSVREGDFIALAKGELVGGAKDVLTALVAAVSACSPNPGSLVTLYYGEDVLPRHAERHAQQIALKLGECEVEVYEGGQSTYAYWIAVE